MKQQINNQRPLELFIHIIGWGILFGFPFFFTNKLGSNNINWQEYLRHTMVPLSLLVVFYINYLYLIPNFFFKNLTKRYIIINIFLVIIMSIGLSVPDRSCPYQYYRRYYRGNNRCWNVLWSEVPCKLAYLHTTMECLFILWSMYYYRYILWMVPCKESCRSRSD